MASACCSIRRALPSTRGSASCRRSRPRCVKPSPQRFEDWSRGHERGPLRAPWCPMRRSAQREGTPVSIFEEPKIDCHVHVLDPARFPYRADTHYAPTGQEIGTPAQLAQVMDAYGTRYALLVGPNSGYGLDNSCMLDTIARGQGRYKGIAVVGNDATFDELRRLKDMGVVGVAWNVTHYGLDYYRYAEPLLQKLVALDMFVDIQVEREQLVPMMPLLTNSGARILVDHCGRPTVDAG